MIINKWHIAMVVCLMITSFCWGGVSGMRWQLNQDEAAFKAADAAIQYVQRRCFGEPGV